MPYLLRLRTSGLRNALLAYRKHRDGAIAASLDAWCFAGARLTTSRRRLRITVIRLGRCIWVIQYRCDFGALRAHRGLLPRRHRQWMEDNVMWSSDYPRTVFTLLHPRYIIERNGTPARRRSATSSERG